MPMNAQYGEMLHLIIKVQFQEDISTKMSKYIWSKYQLQEVEAHVLLHVGWSGPFKNFNFILIYNAEV